MEAERLAREAERDAEAEAGMVVVREAEEVGEVLVAVGEDVMEEDWPMVESRESCAVAAGPPPWRGRSCGDR